MATVSHTIYSHYDPKDRERLERETGQLNDKLEAEHSWKTEPPKYKHQTPAPQFVPAALAYDTWGFSQPSSSHHKLEVTEQSTNNDTFNWYRSLRKTLAADGEVNMQRPSSPPAAPPRQASKPSQPARGKGDKNTWFIMNVINSETLTNAALPPPTLPDILERDPPPKPNECKYTPPVFLEIGPNNRGFAMLQKNGWNEGEALGPDVLRRGRKIEKAHRSPFGDRQDKGKHKARALIPDANQTRLGDIIDLTQSDSESDSDNDGDLGDRVLDKIDMQPRAAVSSIKPELVESDPDTNVSVPGSASPSSEPLDVQEESVYGRKALLTPLATVLKSDRLGIGLKAKTVGPYKASRKRVTHSAAALAAHIRASNELQKKKKELGRGRRGFERQYRKEAMKRQMMLAYMNS